MEEYYYTRSHVPAFGSWDWNSDIPFTQCFESARQAGLFRYSYSEDRDLYVAGDLYENDVVTPAMIVVPRRREKARNPNAKEGKKERTWTVDDAKEPPSPTTMSRPTPKPVDEDLYKISPELLCAKSTKKRGFGFFSSCLLPSCAA
uniref:RIN4 pathogenic type III effector avirulence factor Avr cleavage site domain-containing protein n=1 Tax=Rhizophora mucronata TaxID=61149 RepID=A0A2P2N2Q5_RHIMU